MNRWLARIRVFVGLFCLPWAARAANPAGALRVEVITAYNLVVDSNVESPSSYCPKSGYVGAKIWNDGTNTLNDVFAFVGNYLGGSSNTPGQYPRRAHSPLVGPLPGSQFALTHLGGAAGTADATRYLGTLAPGACVTVYWLVGYPLKDALGHAVWGPSVKPGDDLWLEYDIWARATDGGSTLVADQTRKVTMRNEISAMANKIFPNSANKVPQAYKDLLNIYAPTWINTTVSGAPGTRILTEGIWYDLGNVGAGFDNNLDFVPDRNAWMQPVGDPTLFDPSCFRLAHTRALVIVKLRDGTEDVHIVEDQLYFENLPEDNVGAVGYVAYEFEVLKGRAVSTLTPYQEVASGFDNEKFNGDYGTPAGQAVLESADTSIVMSKDADRAVVYPGSNIAYTISYTNTGVDAVGNPATGHALVVRDQIPAGTRYVAGSAAAGNILPAGVASYKLLYSVDSGATWVTSEPSPATNVTDVQWWLSDPLAGGAAGTVRFSVTVNSPFTLPNPMIVNTGALCIGYSASFLEDTAQTLVLGNNSVGDTLFLDNGNGGGTFGDGVQNGGETGIANITVQLYYDANGNGLADSGETLLASTTTSGSGGYLFSLLPDGKYVVVPDTFDADMPSGCTPTTAIIMGVDLDSARATTTGVAYLLADFGFAPALTLIKSGSTAVREGQIATYTIVVTNRFAGNGSGTGQAASYTLWATNENATYSGAGANSTWLTASNIWSPAATDGLYGSTVFANAGEKVGLSGYKLAAQSGTITNVTLAVVLAPTGSFRAADLLTINLYQAGAVIFTTNYTAASLASGEKTINLTSVQSWPWERFDSTNSLALQLLASKGTGSSGGGSLRIDQAGFRLYTDAITGGGSDDNTLDPVPLIDRYDASLLQFLDATPSVTTNTTSGSVGTLTWSDVGPIYPGGTSSLSVRFTVLQPPNNTAAVITNTAIVMNATYGNGRPANSGTSVVTRTLSPAGSIGDFVWRDLDADGVQDGGNETGIAGVSVTLTPPAGVDLGNGNGGAITNVTDASGAYRFDSLPADGTYTVTVLTSTLPGGSGVNTFDRDGNKNNQTAVVLDFDSTSGGDTILTADFGYQVSAIVEGYLWHDLDRSGEATHESGEDWLSGVTVYLCSGSSSCGAGFALATNTTSTGGYFKFVGNYSGTYTVSVNTNTGRLASGSWTRSFDTDGTSSANTVTLTLPTGGTGRADFSYYLSAAYSLGDTLFYDWNGNGTRDAIDEGLSSITVDLYVDNNRDGVLDVTLDAYVGSAVTDTNGIYGFQNLPASNYYVRVDHTDAQFPPLFEVTADPYGALDGRSLAIITNASRLDQDFGYQPYGSGTIGDTVWVDANGDGLQSGVSETGIPSITVTLFADLNQDGHYVSVTSQITDASGHYAFTGLPDGRYRVDVNTADTDLPVDAFGSACVLTTAASYSILISGGNTVLTADFGFAPLGAIGDTIFWDANRNGTQDYTESGVSGATVKLYFDRDANGLQSAGDVLAATATTDASGRYMFTGLATGRYAVVVAPLGPLATAALSADPSNDGLPCSDPMSTGCDGMLGVNVRYGTVFLGADFGYIPPGTVGDCVWLDSNGNGLREAGEVGLPYVTMSLRSGGTEIATVDTDADGYYLFSGLADGTYTVRVGTNDTDFPSGIGQTVDPDGVLDSEGSQIVVAGGVVTSIGAQACSGCDLAVDFGYRYVGVNALSGTVGLDDPLYNGMLGSGTSGVNGDEAPFVSVGVYLYLWNDDGDGTIEAGETVYINSTATGANGDYAFTGLSSGGANATYLLSLSAPADALRLTTTAASGTPATRVVEALTVSGFSQSVYAVVPIAANVVNVDFAFRSLREYDYGDLPTSYATRREDSPSGARHAQSGTTNLFLGATLDAESNGQPSADALGDGADEDGVVPLGLWQTGVVDRALSITVGRGSGWLTGYIDFNQNGSFADSGEMVIDRAVSAGQYTNAVTVPAGAIATTNATLLPARFRLFASEPTFSALAYAGEAVSGEVEDYRFAFGALSGVVWMDDNLNDAHDPAEARLAGVSVYLDLNGDGTNQVTEPAAVTDATGAYAFGGLPAGTYVVQVVAGTLPANISPWYDIDGITTAHRAAVVLAAGEVRTDVDFGYVSPDAITTTSTSTSTTSTSSTSTSTTTESPTSTSSTTESPTSTSSTTESPTSTSSTTESPTSTSTTTESPTSTSSTTESSTSTSSTTESSTSTSSTTESSTSTSSTTESPTSTSTTTESPTSTSSTTESSTSTSSTTESSTSTSTTTESPTSTSSTTESSTSTSSTTESSTTESPTSTSSTTESSTSTSTTTVSPTSTSSTTSSTTTSSSSTTSSSTSSTTTSSTSTTSSTTTAPSSVESDLSVRVSVRTTNSCGCVCSTVIHTLVVSNAGPARATGVLVRNLRSAGVLLDQSHSGDGTYDAGLWTVGTLDAGQDATLVILSDMVGTGTCTSIVEVVACDQVDIDSTVNNGLTSEDDYATARFSNTLDVHGIPEWWNTYYGLSFADGLLDLDGDGATCRDEYLSGSDPRDAASVLRFASMDFTGTNDITLNLLFGDSREVKLYSADSSNATPLLRLTIPDSTAGAFAWVDPGARGITTQRIYTVTSSCGATTISYSLTYSKFIRVSPPPCSWSLMGVPVNLYPRNNFKDILGQQLASGLTAGAAADDCADRVFIVQNNVWKEFTLADLADESTWWDFNSDGQADADVPPTAAFWVERRCPAGAIGYITWEGPTYTTVPPIHFGTADNGWTIFSWPLPLPAYHRNLGTATPRDQLGFEAAGAKGGKTGAAGKADGDEIWLWTGTAWRHFWLVKIGNPKYDGRWWDDSTGNFADFSLQPGSGYYYHHRGSGFNWTPHN